MNRRILVTLAALVATLATAPAFAQTNVGIVNFDTVFRDSTRAQAVLAEVEAYRQSKAAELQALTQAYQDKLQGMQSAVEPERTRLTRELRDEQTRIQRKQEDIEREGQRLTNNALATLDREIGPLVRELAQEKGLQLILQATPDAGIVFADPAIDVTTELVAKLDAQAAG